MTITASGVFFPSFEKALIDTLGESWEAEDNKVALINDSATPNFDTNAFFADINANEVTGTNWTAGGVALTGTELTTASGTTTFDATDVSVATTTLVSAMCSVYKTTVSGAATDQLIMLHDFVTAVSTSAGTFGIQWNASGLLTLDLTP